MVHCQLPLLSFLCLLGALLLLAPQLTLGIPENFTEVNIKDELFQSALGFAVPLYNQEKKKNANYFKLKKLKAFQKVTKGFQYGFSVAFTKTVCKKTAGKTMTYQEIQRCKAFPGTPQNIICMFKVAPSPLSGEMVLRIIICT